MGKIFCKKKAVNLYAKIVFNEKNYDGYIEDVSCEDDEYLMTFLLNVSIQSESEEMSGIGYKVPSIASEDFKPEKRAEVYFKTHSSEVIKLNCEIIWFLVSQYDHRTEVLGMKLINPPAQYENFMKSLNTSYELAEQEFIADDVDPESHPS